MIKGIRIDDAQRRARLVSRHRVGRRRDGVEGMATDLVAVHASDPVTPYLGAWARVSGFAHGDLDAEVYERRTLWRAHAMRRTLFLLPAADWAIFDAAVGRDVAARERRRLEGWLAAEMPAERVADWVVEVERRVLDVLDDGDEWRTTELARAVPELDTRITLGSGRWATRSPLSSRLLFLLAMDGRIVRSRPAGTWRSSQYRWAAVPAWFGREPTPWDPAEARVELLHRYLAAHGPATTTDVRWWTGWTARHTRDALAAAGAVDVDLENGVGHVLPDDLDAEHGRSRPGRDHSRDAERPLGGAALLPGLDPTVMGWKERGWFLGPHAERLFHDSGNAGPTVWWRGRVVGGWGQRGDGRVVVRLLEDVDAEGRAAVTAEADALTSWLDGVVVSPRFRSPLERELSG